MSIINIDLSSKKNLTYKDLQASLVENLYARVPIVTSRGEFSVRGDIVDIFAQNHSHPVRLEFFGDDIDDIRTFDPYTQRSISKLSKTKIKKADTDTHYFSKTTDTGGLSLDIASGFLVGDHVVHESYGIGVFCGLKHVATANIEGEYVFLKYKGEDEVYVPLEQINLIHKYDFVDIKPELNSLSDKAWTKTKKKAKKSVENIAMELLQLYKIRHNRKGFSFSDDSLWEIDLAKSFPYTETRDQLKAIEDVKKDMESTKPMDRLICGDVGFGKTEIALRAAFKASLDNKQVAILVPTTVLAEQHYRNFLQRFTPFGHRVELLNRFKTRKEQDEILVDLKAGKVDVVIGTHRLISKDVDFKDLGLLIIDEEQRFGVTHKERLKSFRKTVDVLTMSATPIPRTLYMSLSGIRDLSVISTPPIERRPISTKVNPYNEKMIIDAIGKEIERGGQVYYVQNDIRLLNDVKNKLIKLRPDWRVAVAHGQMKGKELERIMVDFLDHKYDVLVCSTIIESGLDIPNVNTIIIIDADRFGLSQLHQLRGRVGRSSKSSYAYLFYKPGREMSKEAKKRLEAITEYVSLGAGFDIAMRDLQIRGAGSVLGAEQHGNMVSVGFDLYCKLLNESISTQKGERPAKSIEYRIGESYIPDSYIPDNKQKMAIYKRLFDCRDEAQLDEIHEELKDRFGTPPEEVDSFIENMKHQL